jgi:hypothetical protein
LFDLGDVVPLTVNIRGADGVLANATAVTLTITLPDGTTTSPAPANPSVGLYQVDYITVMEGRHLVRWVATGNNASAYTDSFDVRPANPPLIMSLSAAKAILNIPSGSTVDDDELRSLVEAVTSAVETYRGEAIVRRTVVENCTATYVAGYQVIPANFIEAAKIILRHLWQTQQTPGFGSRLFSSADDLSSHLTATVSSLGFAIPNRASELLGGKMPVIG